MGVYDVAQICLNGHVITSHYRDYPELRAEYCDECGEKTIIKCTNCERQIKGSYSVQRVIVGGYNRPSYCFACGNAFPWTRTKLDSAKELAGILEGISPEDRAELKKSLDDLVKDSPRTVVASTKFKRLMIKLGPEIAAGFKNILFDVVGESAKKMIWG